MPAPKRLNYSDALAALAGRGIRVQDSDVHNAVKLLASLGMVCQPLERTARPGPRRTRSEPLVPLDEPRRWLQALTHEGWTIPALAEATGLALDTITKIRGVERAGRPASSVTAYSYRAIKELYDDNLAPIRPNRTAQGYARRYGWPTRADIEAAGVQEPETTVE